MRPPPPPLLLAILLPLTLLPFMEGEEEPSEETDCREGWEGGPAVSKAKLEKLDMGI